LVAGEATSVRTVTTGPGAVAPAGRTNLKPFAAVAILLIVAAGGVAGFYAYRRQRAQPTTTPPTETQTQSQPAQPSTNSGAQPNESKDVTGDTAKTNQTKTDKSKPETPRTETQRSTQTPPDAKAQDPFKNFPPPEVFDPAHQADPNRGRDRNPQPGQPPFDPTRPPPEDRRGFHPPLRMPEVRPLPNGGRLIKQPDGSMIMISPDGKTTTIPARPDRRNPRQKGNTNGNDNQGRP
jgi:FtsZ-interacting cell division protein ZipA